MPPLLRSMLSTRHGGWGDFIAEQALFLKVWLRNPLTVGAILPSSLSLAAAITRDIGPQHAPVLELGSGTGAFTRQLITCGIAMHDLHLVEKDETFSHRLHQAFSNAHIYQVDACQVILPAHIQGNVGATISGLPLLNMSPQAQLALLYHVFKQMRPDGAFYAFSYGWHCPIPQAFLNELNLHALHIASIWRNLPPARVWKIQLNIDVTR